MRIYEAADYAGMSRRAANVIAAQVILKPNCVLGLATGSTPVGTYENLIRLYRQGDLSFAETHSVNLDEYRGLGGDHSQSYRYFMYANLFKDVDMVPAHTNFLNGLAEDPQAECARYEQTIRDLGGIDLQLLGLGHNGHIGFNEPATSFENGAHLVELSASTVTANTRFFQREEEVPRQAITVGIGTILRARKVLMVVSGADKADIVCRAFSGPITPEVPASILRLHPDVTLVADAAALSKLKETGVTVWY